MNNHERIVLIVETSPSRSIDQQSKREEACLRQPSPNVRILGGLRCGKNLEIGAVKVQGKILLPVGYKVAQPLHLRISDRCDVKPAQASWMKVGETELSQS